MQGKRKEEAKVEGGGEGAMRMSFAIPSGHRAEVYWRVQCAIAVVAAAAAAAVAAAARTSLVRAVRVG
jgi:hypothetical protein